MLKQSSNLYKYVAPFELLGFRKQTLGGAFYFHHPITNMMVRLCPGAQGLSSGLRTVGSSCMSCFKEGADQQVECCSENKDRRFQSFHD